MQLRDSSKSVSHWESLWVMLMLFDWTGCLAFAQDADVVNLCTKYKKSVYDRQDGYSFLLPNAPITYKLLDACHSYVTAIVGGEAADPKEFPPIARLGNRNSNNETNWFCGGTLISNRLVLTAAHCLYSESGAINVVRLGELDFDSDQDDAEPEDFAVGKTTEHPGFKYPLLYNDIAVIELDRSVRFNVYKHPACLPFNDGNSVDSFIAVGWGQTTFAGRHSSKLQKVQLHGFRDNCSIADDIDELPKGYDARTQLCVGSKQNKDTCLGDSGGPLLTYHENYPCMLHIVGITSLGLGCGTPNVPSFYTRVHSYLDWIKQEIANIA